MSTFGIVHDLGEVTSNLNDRGLLFGRSNKELGESLDNNELFESNEVDQYVQRYMCKKMNETEVTEPEEPHCPNAVDHGHQDVSDATVGCDCGISGDSKVLFVEAMKLLKKQVDITKRMSGDAFIQCHDIDKQCCSKKVPRVNSNDDFETMAVASLKLLQQEVEGLVRCRKAAGGTFTVNI